MNAGDVKTAYNGDEPGLKHAVMVLTGILILVTLIVGIKMQVSSSGDSDGTDSGEFLVVTPDVIPYDTNNKNVAFIPIEGDIEMYGHDGMVRINTKGEMLKEEQDDQGQKHWVSVRWFGYNNVVTLKAVQGTVHVKVIKFEPGSHP